jgi:chromosome segregation ATPase
VKAKRPDKTVADMAVLKDIRGLLSANRDGETVALGPRAAPGEVSTISRLEAQVNQLEESLRKQQAVLERVEAEKNGLQARIDQLQASVSRTPPPKADTGSLGRDVSDLEARKAELEAAVSQIEGLLQIKINDLARRIARVYSEAGDMGASRDFRRIKDQLEAAENFGEFVRALTRE